MMVDNSKAHLAELRFKVVSKIELFNLCTAHTVPYIGTKAAGITQSV